MVGDFNFWDGRVHPMRSLGSSGIWELFLPGVEPGTRYKYEIVAPDGELRLKADPVAFEAEVPPKTASVVYEAKHEWADDAWLAQRRESEPLKGPVSIYEVHLGSWRLNPLEDNRSLSYLELADELAAYAKDMGFTHIELLPVMAHPFTGSWGYQVTSYYAPTPRFGSPDDFKEFVDRLHGHGLGVILDWVPAHFPRDDFALARFDGTALYEHADPRRGAHPDWGTLIFNYGRNEVRNFLVSNALFWLASTTPTASAWTPWPRCSTSTTRARRASGCRTSTAAARTWRPWLSSRSSTRSPTPASRGSSRPPRSRPPGRASRARRTSAASASASSGTWAGCTTRWRTSSRTPCTAAGTTTS